MGDRTQTALVGGLYVLSLAVAVAAVPLLVTAWVLPLLGHPLIGLFLVFLGGLAISYSPLSAPLYQGLMFLARRAGFTSSISDQSEAVRVDLLRIVIGLILLSRAVEVMRGVVWTESLYTMQGVATGFMLVAGFALMVGMLTPLFAALSMAMMAHYVDLAAGTLTLGTYVFMTLAMVLTFLPAGTTLSVDAWLAARSPRWRQILAWLYAPFGAPTAERSAILRLLALAGYSWLCAYSAWYHYQHDAAWREGYANLMALTNSFMSRHFDVFQALYAAYPDLAVWLSQASTWGMIAWEALLFPLVLLSRPTRIFAILWGLAFLVASRFLFSLSYLPYYEFALWALIFHTTWRLNVGGRDTVHVYFDDRCNLCDRTMRALTALDLFGVIVPKPLSKFHDDLADHGISQAEALSDLYGYDPAGGKLHGGYAFYMLIASRILLLVPLYPLLWLGRALRIGPALYRYVAERRIGLFGVCERSSIGSAPRVPLALVPGSQRGVLFALLPGVYLLICLLFVGIWAGVTDTYRQRFPLVHALEWTPLSFGIARINVFNEMDLATANYFVVAHRLDRDGRETLVPYHGLRGERLGMDSSDRILYAVSVPWRRGMGMLSDACQHLTEHHGFAKMVITYDRRSTRQRAPSYRFTYYHQVSLSLARARQREPLSAPQAVCSVTFTGPSLEATSAMLR